IVFQHLFQFRPENDISRSFVGIDQLISINLFLCIQVPENRNERRDAGACCNKNSTALVMNGSEYIVKHEFFACIDTAKLMSDSLAIVVNLNHKFKIIPFY